MRRRLHPRSVVMRTISGRHLLGLVLGALCAVQLAFSSHASALGWPADGGGGSPTCRFNDGCADAPNHHTGVDFSGGTGRIAAVGNGPIIAVVNNGSGDH